MKSAVIPKEWETAIKTYAANDREKVLLYEYIIDYQTDPAPPSIKDLPDNLQFVAGVYMPQMNRMRRKYKEQRERMDNINNLRHRNDIVTTS